MSLSQNQFIVDDVSKIIKEAIENTIGGNAYQHDKGKRPRQLIEGLTDWLQN